VRGESFLTRDVPLGYGDYRLSFHMRRPAKRRDVPPWVYSNQAMRLIFETRLPRVLKMSVGTRESLLRLWCGIVFRCYRLGLTSVEAARELGLSPWQVRQQLFRLNAVARECVPELCLPPRQHGGGLSRRRFLDVKIARLEKLIRRYGRTRRNKWRIPRYQIQLEALREMKTAQDAERAKASVYHAA
jgi:hypothetical protein